MTLAVVVVYYRLKCYFGGDILTINVRGEGNEFVSFLSLFYIFVRIEYDSSSFPTLGYRT